MFGVIVAVLVLAAIIAGVVVLATPGTTVIKLHNVMYHDINQAASSLRELVAENTQ
jgi:hypothetical protein